MKFVIYGVGAIGGALAAKLALSGAEVVGIAPDVSGLMDLVRGGDEELGNVTDRTVEL